MKLKLSAIVALALASSASLGAAEKLTTSTINVISTTPLPSIGLPLSNVPANIQIVSPKEIKKQSGVSIADYMINNLEGVTVNETQGNPFQPDITFRGYSASPLLGSPQGVSVFVDGVRVNEPFGETVSWDLIPTFAIGGMQLVPGSNPVYGLNTLGGAISIQTKDGRNNKGAALEAEAGSWGRYRALAEYGGVSKDGSVDYYFGAQRLDEDGWRKYSPTTVNQAFGKLGWQNETSRLNLSYMGADNDMIGNGLIPTFMLNGDRDQIYTRPDQTKNSMTHIALNGDHWLNKDVMLSGNTYYRNINRNTINGDVNDDYSYKVYDATDRPTNYNIRANGSNIEVCNPAGTFRESVGGTGEEGCAQASLNKTNSHQKNYGFTIQAAFNQDIFNKKNQLITGFGFDYSKVKFGQSSQLSVALDDEVALVGFDSTRGLINLANSVETSVSLAGKTKTYSLFATDTLSLNKEWHVTASARYNYIDLKNDDFLNAPSSNSYLGGNHKFNRVNPSLGLTFTPSESINVYGSYSESSRAPSTIELGCSNPAVPCKLPNAMASDPPLDQVVAKTYDLGLRGKISSDLKWSASYYRAMNHSDIQFISSTTSGAGYFDNVGKTKREGLDLSASGNIDKFRFNVGYSFIRATYESDMTILAESNSSRDNDEQINITKGNYLAGIPKHQFKLRGAYDVTPDWSVGANLLAFSSQYMRGNENNKHQENSALCASDGDEVNCGKGKIAGYAIVNLDSQYNVGKGWKLFAKAINVFDQDYASVGRLGISRFDSAGVWSTDGIGSAFVAPGAPRAGWIGVRYEFGGAPEAK
jgi:outer membrane receptor protein involved in Fe transport